MSLIRVIESSLNWLYDKYSSIFHHCSSNERGFYSETTWIRTVHSFFGMLPIYQEKCGEIGYKYLSFRMLYSVVTYALLTTLCYTTIFIKRVEKLMNEVNNFDNFIYNLMFVSFVKTQFFYSIGGWLAMKDVALYHNMWINYEQVYKKKLKKPLILKSMKTYSNKVVLKCLITSMCLIGGQLFTLPTYTLQECIAYIPSVSCTFFYIGIVLIYCSALNKASECLFEELKNDLQRSPVTQDIILLHNKLWNDLSNITQQLGTAFFNYNFIVMVGTVIDVIMSGYGYLSIVLTKLKTNVSFTTISNEEFGLIVASACSLIVLVIITNSYHYVTDLLSTPFIDELCMATTCYHHPKVNKQIDIFLMTIKSNPPIITLGGYVDIDRSFLTKVISIAMTYYVVLIQFKVSFDGQINYTSTRA